MKMDLERVISESGVWLNSTFIAFTYLDDDANHDVAVLWQRSKQIYTCIGSRHAIVISSLPSSATNFRREINI